MRGIRKFKNSLEWDVIFNGDLCRLISIPFFRILHFNVIPDNKITAMDRKALQFLVQPVKDCAICRMVSTTVDPSIHFETGTSNNDGLLLQQMIRLSQAMAHCSASWGAILLHGALASWKRKGVLLCGVSGSGKTTASRRLPSPWRSLSDDATLLVRDRLGRYWAHSWPTWSLYPSKKRNPIQPLSEPVRLHAICFLRKSVKDGIACASPKESVVRLMAASEQAVNLAAGIMPVAPRNRQRVARLDLCCDLVREIPLFHLLVSLKGRFWELIEKTLNLQVRR